MVNPPVQGSLSRTYGSEDRDPSPSTGISAPNVNRSESSDEVEPWDERHKPVSLPESRPRTSASFEYRSPDDEMIQLDDGDLPPLSRARKSPTDQLSGDLSPLGRSRKPPEDPKDLLTLSQQLRSEQVRGQLVTGHKITRPLSPPSRAGLAMEPVRLRRGLSPKTHRKKLELSHFLSQLDPDTPPKPKEVHETDNVPDDELADRNAAREQDLKDGPQRDDEVLEAEEEKEISYSYVQPGLLHPEPKADEPDDTDCFHSTLESVDSLCGTICGTEGGSPTRMNGSPMRNGQSPTKVNESPMRNGESPTKTYESPTRNQRNIIYNRDISIFDSHNRSMDEQTAIEVEYVEPPPIEIKRSPIEQKRSPGIETKRSKTPEKSRSMDEEQDSTRPIPLKKSAYLTSMARKAKEAFEKHEGEKTKREPPRPESPRAAASVATDDGSDVYSGFNATEKRKFLKLINGGLTPKESSRRVVEERKQSERAKTPLSNGKSRFSFWKKGSNKDRAGNGQIESPESFPVADLPKESMQATEGVVKAPSTEVDAVVHQNSKDITADDKQNSTDAFIDIKPNSMDAADVKQNSADAGADVGHHKAVHWAPSTPRGLISTEAPSPEYPDDAMVTLEIIADLNGLDDSVEMYNPNVTVDDSVEMLYPKDETPPVPPSVTPSIPPSVTPEAVQVVAAAAVEVETASSTLVSSSPDDEGNDDDGDIQAHFVKSGLNYYDAVRKDLPEDDEDEDEDDYFVASIPVKEKPRNSRLAGLLVSPRAYGFMVLNDKDKREKDKNEEEKARSVEIAESPGTTSAPLPLPRGANAGREANVETDQSASISPEITGFGRRRVLGIPLRAVTQERFTTLEEDDVAAELDATLYSNVSENESGDVIPDNAKNKVIAPPADESFFFNEKSPAYLEGDESDFHRIEPSENGKQASNQETNTSTIKLATPKRHGERQNQMVRIDEPPYNEDDSFAKLEKELLLLSGVPVAMEHPAETSIDDSDTIFDMESPERVAEKPKANGKRIQIDDMDMSLETYLDSTTSHSYGSTHDHMSVVSGKSGWTGATGTSSVYTQSSRKRRPGAAKERLAKAKEAEMATTKKGWHESIRAAASSTNRVWDPEKGWVDYRDSAPQAPKSEERLRVSLNRVTMRPINEGEVNNERGRSVDDPSPPVIVPFPKEWEEEREAMISPRREATISASDGLAARPAVTRKESKTSSRSVPQRALRVVPSKPQGWAESMRAVTDGMNAEGKRWDPKNGWVVTDTELKSDVNQLNVSADNSVATEGTPEKEEEPTAEDHEEATVTKVPLTGTEIESSVPAAGSMSPDDSEEEAADPRDLSQIGVAPSPVASETKKDEKSPLYNWIAKSTKPSKPRSEQSTEGSDQAVTSSVGAEKYVQLGDNGSVRSVVRATVNASVIDDEKNAQPIASASEILETSSADDFGETDTIDDDTAPLLTDSVFSNSAVEKAAAVTVVKEKCDEDDINLFAYDDSATLEGSSDDEPVSPSKRRGQGPVDVDDVDDLDTDDDEDDDDEPSWEPDSFLQGHVSNSMFNNPKSPVRGVAASKSDLDQASNKTPPRLERSKKDTSPLRERGSGLGQAMNTTPPRLERNKRDTSPLRERGSELDQPINKTPPRLERNKRDTSPLGERVRSTPNLPSSESVADAKESYSASRSVDDSAASARAKSIVRLRARQWETMSGRPSRSDGEVDASNEDDLDSPIAEDTHVASLNSNLLRSSQDEVSWPDATESINQNESPAGTAEWKSFLGKKVRAESAAATKHKENSQYHESQGRASSDDALPVVGSHTSRPRSFPRERSSNEPMQRGLGVQTRQIDDEADSIFEFNDTPTNDVDIFTARIQASVKRSGAHTYRGTRDPKYYQSPQRGPNMAEDSFSDISPIPKEDEDEGNFEQVSDSGTAIEQGSFFKRLSACAAPILPRQFTQGSNTDSVPMAHLAFLRTNPPIARGSGSTPKGSARFLPPALCGRPDTITEDEDDEVRLPHTQKEVLHQIGRSSSQASSRESRRSRQRSSPKPVVSEMRASSSVSSEDFGARTSYLEAIAMKTAVSNPKRGDSRRRSPVSDVSTGSRRSHSEQWQSFLDRKAAGASPTNSRTQSSTEVSKAAEKYAAEKVEEMMQAMSSRSKSTPRSWKSRNDSVGGRSRVEDMMDTLSTTSSSSPLHLSESQTVRSDGDRSKSKTTKKSESAKAAEELAAARVEAMMAAMTSSTLDEGEI